MNRDERESLILRLGLANAQTIASQAERSTQPEPLLWQAPAAPEPPEPARRNPRPVTRKAAPARPPASARQIEALADGIGAALVAHRREIEAEAQHRLAEIIERVAALEGAAAAPKAVRSRAKVLDMRPLLADRKGHAA